MKVGKNTPIWRNKSTGEIVVGPTLREALGLDISSQPSRDWVSVTELPRSKRVVIEKGKVLPVNDITTYICEHAAIIGKMTVDAYGRKYKVKIIYIDDARIILG